jgi:hypothetical protein
MNMLKELWQNSVEEDLQRFFLFWFGGAIMTSLALGYIYKPADFVGGLLGGVVIAMCLTILRIRDRMNL